MKRAKLQKLSYREISFICLELSLFVHAGVPNGEALALISQRLEGARFKKAFAQMAVEADKGTLLSKIFEDSMLFPSDVSAMISVGESTGKLEETLKGLSDYYTSLDNIDRQIHSAITYPSTLMLVMAVVILLLIAYVVPIFNEVYQMLGGELVGMAGAFLTFSGILKSIFPLVCVVIAICLGLLVCFSISQSFRSRILGIGTKKQRGISKKINSARFATALYMGISGGLTIDVAIEKAGALLSSPVMADKAKECAQKLQSGVSLSDALSQSSLMPTAECSLVVLGVKGGNAEIATNEVARRLERDAKEALENATSKVEPVAVILSCLIIGTIILSIMLPLTQIMSSIG